MNKITPWFAGICNYIVAPKFPPEASKLYKEKLESDAKYYIWDDLYLWRLYNDQVTRRCILDPEIKSVLHFCHSTFGGVSNQYSYILLAIDYVSQWVEIEATKTNIFYRFGVSKALISDQESQFCNKAMSSLFDKYGVVQRIATTYHPQTNGQAEVFNREIKKILQKIANPSRKDWSRLLENALWEHRTAYQTLLGMLPYQIVFGKACHLPVEVEHRADWAVKQCNLAYDQAEKERKLQLQELEELCLKT
ncbi:gag-pol, partial [Mucuna pruriens]